MSKNKLFMEYLKKILEAKDADEMTTLFYKADISYQHDLLTWDQIETLLKVVNKINK